MIILISADQMNHHLKGEYNLHTQGNAADVHVQHILQKLRHIVP